MSREIIHAALLTVFALVIAGIGPFGIIAMQVPRGERWRYFFNPVSLFGYGLAVWLLFGAARIAGVVEL
jgi:hypothetical protein